MSDSPERPLPAQRAADADRDAAARRLRDAAGEGRLDFVELETRLEAVYSAKTLAELSAITADLPEVVASETGPLVLKTRSGSLSKRGYWRVPKEITAECTSGSIKLDFTEAECSHREVEIRVTAKSGAVVIIVPKGWAVDLGQASATSGTIRSRVNERPDTGAPLLRVNGTVLSGTIKARYPRRSFLEWLSGRQK